MKNLFQTLTAILILTFIINGCGPKNSCKYVACTLEYRIFMTKLVDPSGHLYLADSIQVSYNGNVINSSQFSASTDSSYELLSDNHMKYIPLNVESNLQGNVFKNNSVVKSFNFKATKDCCHIDLVGSIGNVIVP